MEICNQVSLEQTERRITDFSLDLYGDYEPLDPLYAEDLAKYEKDELGIDDADLTG